MTNPFGCHWLGSVAIALQTTANAVSSDVFKTLDFTLPITEAFLMGMVGGEQATIPNAVWAEFCGTRHIDSIKSAVATVMVLESAIGPGLTGWLIDLGNRFETQLYGFALAFVFAIVVMLIPLRQARPGLAVTP